MSGLIEVEVKAKGMRGSGKSTILIQIESLLKKEGFKTDSSRIFSGNFSGGDVEVLKASRSR